MIFHPASCLAVKDGTAIVISRGKVEDIRGKRGKKGKK